MSGPRRAQPGEETTAFPTTTVLLNEPFPSRRVSRALVILSIVFTATYAGWWLAPIPDKVGSLPLFIALLLAETFTVTHLVGLWQTIWSADFTPPGPGEQHFTVDVFIPTLGEPLDVLGPTIQAAVEMDGTHTTYVLDDGVRDEVRQLAESLGARYIPRESSQGAKAGNLNNALRRTDGDLIVVFDADHVARRDFLTHLLGYFEDPTVAVVQTPQFYGNAVANDVARGAWYQQVFFYGPILRGRHALNSAFLCGTNAVVRREALRQVGGFHEDNVTEDVVTSMAMNYRGWKVRYFPFVLTEGDGPETLTGYVKQQFRWALGSIGALLSGMPFRSALSWIQRFQFLLTTTYYLIGFATVVYISLPVLALVGRLAPFGPGGVSFLIFYFPHILLALLLTRRELRGNFGLRHAQFSYGMFPVYIGAALSGLRSRGRGEFAVTGATSEGGPPGLLWITVAAFVAMASAAVAGPLIHGLDAWTYVSLFWALVNLALLWGVTKLTVRSWWRARRGTPTPDTEHATFLLDRFVIPPLPEQISVRGLAAQEETSAAS